MIAAPRITYEMQPNLTGRSYDGQRALTCDVTGRAFLWPIDRPVPVLRYRHHRSARIEGTSDVLGHDALVIDPELAERGPDAIWDALRACIQRHRLTAADELRRAEYLERALNEPWETSTPN
jgi:hypothetical protein